MSCTNINSGYALACRESQGGIKAVYFTELANKATVTTDVNNIITGMTLSAATKFYKYETKDTSSYDETFTVSQENGTMFADQAINLILNKMDSTKRNQIKLLGQNSLMAIIYFTTGDYLLVGETRGIDLATSKGSSGTALGDRNGYTLSFAGKEPELARYVSSSLIASLT